MNATSTTISAPFDSRLGAITEGLKLFSFEELHAWLHSNRMEIQGALKRAVGKEYNLESWQVRNMALGSSKDPRPKPEPYAVERYSIVNGKTTMQIRRGTVSRTVDYMDAAKHYTRDADEFINQQMQGFLDRIRKQAAQEKRRIEQEAAREAQSALAEARAIIRDDSEQDPRVRAARASINPAYKAKVDRAALLVEMETTATKQKKPFAMLYASAKMAGKI